MKAMNRLIHDERTYIESIGKEDKETVRGALADKGADTILRICIGSSEQPKPVRALGYFASAIAVQEHYLPKAELQVVFPTNVAQAARSDNAPAARFQPDISAEQLYDEAEAIFARRMHAESPQRAHIRGLYDRELPGEDLKEAVATVLEHTPELTARFEASAKARGADYLTYVAAHVLMHDTNPLLQEFRPDYQPVQPEAPRVISIGAQSERPFYAARMACRRAGILPPDKQVQTGQLFTRHVLPPYLQCREGEPYLDRSGVVNTMPDPHPVPSVERDLVYMAKAYKAENEQLEAITRRTQRMDLRSWSVVEEREFI